MYVLVFAMQQDTVNNLRKAQALYISRQQELERVRDTLQKAEGEKMEKRKRSEEEAMHKVTFLQFPREIFRWQLISFLLLLILFKRNKDTSNS